MHLFQGLFYALGQLQALAHVEIGGEDLEWSADDGTRHDNIGARPSLVEAVASGNLKRLSVMQSHVVDSVVVSNSAHIQHTLRLLQVSINRFSISHVLHLMLLPAPHAA
jgi:hypothetical protein